jgi:outer membrane protein assembly factor BamB
MARGGRELQGRVPAAAPRQPKIEWTCQVKGAITSEAAAGAGVVVFGSNEGVIHAVDLATHKPLWEMTTDDTIQATPAIADGRVFIGSDDGVFRALNLRDGKPLWELKSEDKFPTGATLVKPPDGGEIRLLINGYDGMTHCLRSDDGSPLWQHKTEDYINGSPLVLAGDLVAFGGCDAVIHLLRLADGTAVHSLKVDAQIVNSLSSWEGTVYGINYANQLIAADVKAEKPTWIYEPAGAQFLTAPAVDEELVYVGSRDKHLHAVDRLTGKLRWKFQTSGRVSSAPLVFNDAVVFGSSDGRLYAVTKADGKELWRLDLGEELLVAPAYVGGRIAIGGNDGTFFMVQGNAQP